MFSESALFEKYKKLVYKTVHTYCGSFNTIHQMDSIKDDLINEASLVFITECRKMEIVDNTLNDFQIYVVKKQIVSALRVYIWKYFNMGGNNNIKKIDYDRNRTITDVVGDAPDADCVIGGKFDDYSKIEFDSFIKSLPERHQKMIGMLDYGFTMQEISKLLNLKLVTAYKSIDFVRKKYAHEMMSA